MATSNSNRNSRDFTPEHGQGNTVNEVNLPRLARMVRKAYGLALEHGNTLYDYRAAQRRKNRI